MEKQELHIDFKVAKAAFEKYLDEYDRTDDKIHLKIVHTYCVVDAAEEIATRMHLREEDVQLAKIIGLLHDIGRFEQIRRFGTFNDVQSVDHAEFGADLLFKEGLIRKFAEGYYEECELAQSDNQSDYCQEERKTKEFLVNNDATAVDDEQIIKNNEYHNKDTGLLEMAIRQHNKYRVKEDLTERQRMFCDILRDADKVDIFKVNADIPMEIIYDVTTEELKNGIITKEVLESFYKKETVLKSVRRSAVDHIVGHISLLFELVYKESYRQAKEQGYVYKLLDFKSDVPEVNAEFDNMRKYVDEFLMEI
mgnify:FL=1